MITPRRTRLLRVRNLRDFRDAIAGSVFPDRSGAPEDESAEPSRRGLPSRLVVVPSTAAAEQLRRSLRHRQRDVESTELPVLVTREQLYDRLHERLRDPPRRLSPYERDVMAQAAAREASAELGFTSSPSSFRLRPGLVAEMLRFYDQLRRQSQQVGRFEELLTETLGRDVELDRGARRMLQQTRLLAATFRAYERRVLESGACDEHALRERLLVDPSPLPLSAIIVTTADWIADPDGLYVSDFDLLARLPGVRAVELIVTEATLASGFHQRIHDWLPGLAEVEFRTSASQSQPMIAVPANAPNRRWFLSRDREEELIGIARRLKAQHRKHALTGVTPRPLDRAGVVYKRPLPYLYLAREVFGGAGIPYQASDSLPLAAEPFSAALDLVLEFVASSFTRDALVALLRSPYFVFEIKGRAIGRDRISALDRALSEARFLGELEPLALLAAAWPSEAASAAAVPALQAALKAAEQLAPLRTPAPASTQIERLLSFLAAHDALAARDTPRPGGGAEGGAEQDLIVSRERRGRAAIIVTLEAVAAASRAYDDALVDVEALASIVRRAVEGQTFAPDPQAPRAGLHLLDEQAARYGDFDEIAIVGLIEGEWPDRPRRNIFYPPSLLNALGWPSEKDRQSAAQARFIDLLASPSERVYLSTITLDDETLVEPSSLFDEVTRARLSETACDGLPDGRIFIEEALALDPVATGPLDQGPRQWAEMRLARTPAHDSRFHGQTGALHSRPWSVSAIETYLACPFKFFAQHVLRLEEDPDDEEVMDPRSQGQFVHKVFESFFKRWQEDGHPAIAPHNLDEARAVFEEVVEAHLGELPEAEAALERTHLLGSPAAAGLGEAVLRMEAERPVGVVGRLLEVPLRGDFTFQTAAGPRVVSLSGKADRIDLMTDGTLRVIDYKLGYPPNRARALQLPIYSLCAEQQLSGHNGRHWTIGEAVYLAFKGPKRVVPLFTPTDRDRVLRESQQRLVDAIDAIGRGEFPPHPDDVYRCEACAFASVCRKDYVGDV